MTTITDFYTQNDEAFALISKIRLPEDYNPKKKYYFDDLVMSNILSFIPKYPKKAERYDNFRVGVFEDCNTWRERKNKKSYCIIIITKITPKMLHYTLIDYWCNQTTKKRKIKELEDGRGDFVYDSDFEGDFKAIDLIPLRQKETLNKVIDKSWFRSDDPNVRVPLSEKIIKNLN